MPVSLKARPYLALCIAFDFKKNVFRAFVLFFFLSPNVPSPSRPKCPCANKKCSFFAKKKENRGDSCTGSGQT